MPRGQTKGFADPARTTEIIRLVEQEGWTLQDCADLFAISRERARQIYTKATGRQPGFKISALKKTCIVPGCSRHPDVGVRCYPHRMKYVTTGTDERIIFPVPDEACACGKPAWHSSGRCQVCHLRWRYHNDPKRRQDCKEAMRRVRSRGYAYSSRNPERLARIRADLAAGLSKAEIARREGIAAPVVRYYVRFHGLQP